MQVLNRIRQPEHTGANRCVPCTVVNLAIALVGSAVIAVVSVPAGVIALAASVALIALRGYLVPGTPTLTRRYFPRSVLRWFGKGPATAESGDEDDGMLDEETAAALRATGILAECETEDDLCLSDEFRDAWRERIRAVRDETDRAGALANALGVDPAATDLTDRGGVYFASLDGSQIGEWPSEAALVAEIAAGRVLDGWLDGWRDLDGATRGDVLASLRLFLRRCPTCDGPASAEEDFTERAAVGACCFSHTVLEVRCERCDALLFQSNAVYE